MKKYKRQEEEAKDKGADVLTLSLESELPMAEMMAGVREEVETFAAQLGLTIMQRVTLLPVRPGKSSAAGVP